MGRYYAITRRRGRWVYVCSGGDAEQVYRDALDILGGPELYPGEEAVAASPATERALDTLRVVPQETATAKYGVTFAPAQHEQ